LVTKEAEPEPVGAVAEGGEEGEPGEGEG